MDHSPSSHPTPSQWNWTYFRWQPIQIADNKSQIFSSIHYHKTVIWYQTFQKDYVKPYRSKGTKENSIFLTKETEQSGKEVAVFIRQMERLKVNRKTTASAYIPNLDSHANEVCFSQEPEG